MGLRKLADLKPADLPAKTVSNWKLTGPGAVLVGLSIGGGEIVVWPHITAHFGASMAWAAAAGVFLQLWINFEVGRWTIATGETVYTGFARAWRGFAPLFVLLTIMGWLVPAWARASGSALKALVVGPHGWGSDTFWTAVTFAGVALVLFGPKLVYKSVERTIMTLVVIVVAGLMIVAAKVGSAGDWLALGRGLVNVPYRHPDMDVKKFFIAVVFAGAGGTANLFYTFYLRDKHIGMGARIPALRNPLRGRTEKTPTTGYRFPDTPENQRNFRGWFDFVWKDQALYFWLLNTLTILLFIFGALAVLHARGRGMNEGTLIWDEAQVLGEVWGTPGRVIFLLVGVATLLSTQLALVDGVSRSIADILHTNYAFAQERELSWWYAGIAGAWIVLGCAITFVMESYVSDLGFLLNAAYMGGFAMAIYVPLLLYVNHRFLPRSARPGWLCTGMMTLATVVYTGFAVACVYWEIARLIARPV